MQFFKLRTVGDHLYFNPAWRDSQWEPDAEKGKSYQSLNSVRSAARGFLNNTRGAGYARLEEHLGRTPTATDLELVEFTATETGTAAV